MTPNDWLHVAAGAALTTACLFAAWREAHALVADVRYALRTGQRRPATRWLSCPRCGAYHLRHRSTRTARRRGAP